MIETASAVEALSIGAKATLRITEITGSVVTRRISEIGKNMVRRLTGSSNDLEQL